MANSDKKYRYTGPLNGVTLKPEKESDKPREVMLYSDTEVTLPADNEFVKTLLAQGLLMEIQAEEATVSKPAKQDKKEVSDAR